MTIIQADREAAARIYQRFRDHDYAKWIMEGANAGGDGDSVIQAFAAHREADRAALVAEIVAWLRRDDFIATADAIERGDYKESRP